MFHYFIDLKFRSQFYFSILHFPTKQKVLEGAIYPIKIT